MLVVGLDNFAVGPMSGLPTDKHTLMYLILRCLPWHESERKVNKSCNRVYIKCGVKRTALVWSYSNEDLNNFAVGTISALSMDKPFLMGMIWGYLPLQLSDCKVNNSCNKVYIKVECKGSVLKCSYSHEDLDNLIKGILFALSIGNHILTLMVGGCLPLHESEFKVNKSCDQSSHLGEGQSYN